MTVEEYLAKIKSYPEHFQKELLTMPIWNDASCMGYCMIALQNLGATGEQIQEVIQELRVVMDAIEPGEAATCFNGLP